MDINKLWKNGQNARFIKVSGDCLVVKWACQQRPLPALILNYFFLG